MNKGTVYWVTGLSGAGKTTIGKIIFNKIKSIKNNVVFLDGDMLRKVFNNDIGYSLDDRFKGAMRNARVCHMLAEQGIDVVCCTIGMFDEVRNWNRKHIENYREIYLKVSLEVLKQRDQKGLYSGVVAGALGDVVGMDLNVQFPKNPDIEVVNDGDKTPEKIVEGILNSLNKVG